MYTADRATNNDNVPTVDHINVQMDTRGADNDTIMNASTENLIDLDGQDLLEIPSATFLDPIESTEISSAINTKDVVVFDQINIPIDEAEPGLNVSTENLIDSGDLGFLAVPPTPFLEPIESSELRSEINCPHCKAAIQLTTPRGSEPIVTGHTPVSEVNKNEPEVTSENEAGDIKSQVGSDPILNTQISCPCCNEYIDLSTPYDGIPTVGFSTATVPQLTPEQFLQKAVHYQEAESHPIKRKKKVVRIIHLIINKAFK